MGGGISTIVDEWKSEDGKQWYRVWSSGFIEQGGYRSSKGNVVSFTVPFTNVNYSFFIFCKNGSSVDSDYDWYSNKTTNSITTLKQEVGAWYACGF